MRGCAGDEIFTNISAASSHPCPIRYWFYVDIYLLKTAFWVHASLHLPPTLLRAQWEWAQICARAEGGRAWIHRLYTTLPPYIYIYILHTNITPHTHSPAAPWSTYLAGVGCSLASLGPSVSAPLRRLRERRTRPEHPRVQLPAPRAAGSLGLGTPHGRSPARPRCLAGCPWPWRFLLAGFPRHSRREGWPGCWLAVGSRCQQ